MTVILFMSRVSGLPLSSNLPVRKRLIFWLMVYPVSGSIRAASFLNFLQTVFLKCSSCYFEDRGEGLVCPAPA